MFHGFVFLYFLFFYFFTVVVVLALFVMLCVFVCWLLIAIPYCSLSDV